MSGSRVKAIRKLYLKIHGRAPRRAGWSSGVVTKHQYRTRTSTRLGLIFGKLKAIFRREVAIESPSEWRQVKNAWKRGGLHALESV